MSQFVRSGRSMYEGTYCLPAVPLANMEMKCLGTNICLSGQCVLGLTSANVIMWPLFVPSLVLWCVSEHLKMQL